MAAPGGRIPRRFTLPRRYHRALQITALPEWARTQGVPGGPAVGSEHRPRLSTPADNQRHFFADGRATKPRAKRPGRRLVSSITCRWGRQVGFVDESFDRKSKVRGHVHNSTRSLQPIDAETASWSDARAPPKVKDLSLHVFDSVDVPPRSRSG